MACKKNTYIVVETQLKVCHCHAEWLFLASSQSSCPPKHNKETPTAFEIALAMLNKNGQHDKGYNNKKCRWKRITHKRINKNVALPQYAICLRDAMHIRLYFGRTFRAKKKENISNKGSNNNNKSEGILYVKSSLCVYQLCVCVCACESVFVWGCEAKPFLCDPNDGMRISRNCPTNNKLMGLPDNGAQLMQPKKGLRVGASVSAQRRRFSHHTSTLLPNGFSLYVCLFL